MADAKKKESKLLKLTEVSKETVAPKKSMKEMIASVNKEMSLSGFNKVELGSSRNSPEVIPSGILALDYALGIGGFPRGKVVQLYGAEASYKSTICLRTIAECQKRGGVAVWVDAEFGFDPRWAQANGVDIENLAVVNPDTQEDALNIIESFAKQGADIIVLDSLIALAPTKELYKDKTKATIEDLDKEQMGIFAKTMSKWFRRSMKVFAEHKTLFMIVNQIRSSLSPYGPPTSVPGGKAVKFYNSISVNCKRLTAAADQVLDSKTKKPIGAKYQLLIDKTRWGVIGTSTTITTLGPHIENFTTLRDIAIDMNIIEKVNSSNYMVNGEKITGKEKVAVALAKDKDLCAKIEEACRNKMGFNVLEDLKAITDAIEVDIPDEEMEEFEDDGTTEE